MLLPGVYDSISAIHLQEADQAKGQVAGQLASVHNSTVQQQCPMAWVTVQTHLYKSTEVARIFVDGTAISRKL